MDCECLPTCIFFNDRMNDMPAIANIYKKRYCLEEWRICARFVVYRALGRDKVPADLFPNQSERAQALIHRSSPRS